MTRLGTVAALLPLPGCIAVAGPCDLAREPVAWHLSCSLGGSAVVMPPSTLRTFIPVAAASAPASVPEAKP
jgi:hypothetical protein